MGRAFFAARIGFMGAVAVLLIQAALTRGAVAQTSAATEATDYGVAEVTEVVVTAQRREQSLQSVPISVQAVAGDQLQRKDILDARDLAAVLPTVNFSAGNSPGASAFALRGVSSVVLTTGIQPSTAMVVDGVPVFRQGEFIAELADVNRVEVLNGPQGTLFGKNSTAGVINIVTNLPGHKFDGSAEVLATNDNEYSGRATLNVPLSDSVRLRVNGFYRDQSPIIKNVSGPDIIGRKTYGGNAKLELDVADAATLLIAGTYAHADSSEYQLIPIRPSIFGAQQASLVGVPIQRGSERVNLNSPTIDYLTTRNGSATFNWNVSEQWKLVAIANYTKFGTDGAMDADGTPAGAAVGVGELIPGSTYPFQQIFAGFPRIPDDYDYYSAEVRANYDAGPINAIVGAYYQHVHEKVIENNPNNLDGALLGLTPGDRYFALNLLHAHLTDESASAFGDVTYALLEHLSMFGGFRYTHETVQAQYHRDDYLGSYSLYNPITGVFSGAPYSSFDSPSEHSINNVSGRAGVQWEPAAGLNFYASYSKGYKSPAVDLGSALAMGRDPIINPETAHAFEAGAKLRLLDNRASINVAAFYETIDNIQEAIILPGPDVNPSLINAGKLKTRGIEADSELAVTRGFHVGAALTYDKATYAGFNTLCNSTQLAMGTCPNRGGVGRQDVTGQPAVGAPKWKYSLRGSYEGQFIHTRLRDFAQVDWTWTSPIQYQLGNDPLSVEPSHGLLNASLGLRAADDRWEVQLFGKNLTNQFYYTNLTVSPIIGQPFGFISRDVMRYGGVRLTVRF